MASLFVIQGPDQGKRFDLKESAGQGPIVIGRDSANRVRLADNEVSRRHAEIQLLSEGEGLRLVDLSSANGTFINGKPSAQVILRSGDQIRLGQTVLLFNESSARGERDLWSRVELLGNSGPGTNRSEILKSLPSGEGSRILQAPEFAGDWLKVRLSNLATLYQATLAVSHILDLDVLLDQILQLAFESVSADRGVVLMLKADAEPEPRAVRWRGVIKPEDRFAVSRTIVDHVLEHGQGVITVDAPADRRFAEAKSVVDFGIREAICVPIQGRHSTYGVLYVDARALVDSLGAPEPEAVSVPAPSSSPSMNTLAAGPSPLKTKLTKDHLALMAAIGHQAGLAVENTQFHEAKIEAERLAAVGQTITTLSHHIKNILQGIRGGSYLIQTGLDGKDETTVRKGWTIVEKNQNKIYDLVMDMLSFSKEREPSLDCNNLNRVLADVVELMATRASEQGVQLVWSPTPGLPEFLFDEEGIHRATLNLVTNAIDAVANAPEARVVVSASRGDSMIRIVVEDNGPGIPEAEVESIFKIFESSKGSRGTGLGLPVSDKIIREHGGSISVESQVGQGTRFAMELPIRRCDDSEATLGGPPL